MSIMQTHIDELGSKFGKVSFVHRASLETVLKVEHLEPTTGYMLELYVTLDSAYPHSSPRVTHLNGQHVSIAPGGYLVDMNQSTGNTSVGTAWDPATSRLSDAVANAFLNAAKLWGSVAPPTEAGIYACLNTLTDSMLHDICTNSHYLELYAQQLPFSKALREARRQEIDSLDRLLRSEKGLRQSVGELHSEVGQLQEHLESLLALVEKFEDTAPIVCSIGSPDALSRTFATDVKTLDARCEATARELLAVEYGTDKRSFDTLLEDFKRQAKERHVMDLKRRAYHASLT
ncbi:putative Modifier of rudimentary (Mod(r)) protein [Trypanosoma vivax]|uniref:VPS37 C-terminal domain-containing protein n=1 Tax=Trypanosoma vivax (strain Y486) TaxID=1055687 RepID=G0UC62_TRYVY|nr:hypothetical protein TRVL_00796 [Trypanosoma vivax]KAH8609501.1 putative Modifier of rudimentary (Mod(r)) protein [Trypanosoma vivax]CCC53410.1 conserved hypothetical protein [Trypanosoma vivax Y486]